MLNRYEQVVLTYTRQWQTWAFLAAWAAILVIAGQAPSWFRQMMMFVFFSLAGTGPAAVIGQAKAQVADARSSLTPGFRTPHVVVAVVLSLGAIVLLPLLSAGTLQTPLIGLIAAVAVVSAAFSLLAYFQSVWAIAVGMGGAGSMMLEPVREAGLAMMNGQRFDLALIALVTSTAVLGTIFYRLAVLHEGMGEYSRILSDRGDFARGSMRVEPRPESLPLTVSLLTRLQQAGADQRLRAIRNVFAATSWRRVRHWMLSGEMGGSKWAAAALLALFLAALPVFIPGGDEKASVALGAVMSVLLPVFCVTATWMSRRRSMGYELTRPVPRDRFVRELGLAIATDLAEWWLWLTLAALVPILIWGPPLRVTDVLAMIAVSAAQQVLAFGILATVLRLRSPQASDGSIMFSIVLVLAPLMATASIPRAPGLTLAIAAGAASLGAALAYDAYRRWCETDLA